MQKYDSSDDLEQLSTSEPLAFSKYNEKNYDGAG
jgi:hypothetical protein